jgi:hypothetical protein
MHMARELWPRAWQSLIGRLGHDGPPLASWPRPACRSHPAPAGGVLIAIPVAIRALPDLCRGIVSGASPLVSY